MGEPGAHIFVFMLFCLVVAAIALAFYTDKATLPPNAYKIAADD